MFRNSIRSYVIVLVAFFVPFGIGLIAQDGANPNAGIALNGGGGGGGGSSLLATANTWALTQTFPTIAFTGGTKINGQSTDGWLQITNNANNGFNRVIMGPATVNGFAFYAVNAGILRFFDGAFPGSPIDTVAKTVYAEAGINLNTFQGTSLVTLSSTRPTIASGFGSTGVVSGNSGAVVFRVVTGADTTGVLTMSPAATIGWGCTIDDLTTSNLTSRQSAFTTTSVTFTTTAAWTASDVLLIKCAAF